MTNKIDAPSGAPPIYSVHSNTQSPNATPYPPQRAHLANNSGSPPPAGVGYYGVSSPYPAYAHPQYGYYPPGGGGPGAQDPYGSPHGGYYAQQAPMGYAPQHANMYGPGPYPPGGGHPAGYGYYGRPQGGYVDDRRNLGFMEAMLASLACCCCLEACLLF